MELPEAEKEEDLFLGANERRKACESPRQPIKSTAVVKRSTGRLVPNFERLQLDTDLKRPPSNWLRSSAESYSLQPVPAYSSGFSSLRMAHAFPDCVGEVDVISDAENIKKLLKIPYSETHVSMMVHRVENTVLIDEFDVHKHLMRTAETEWEWLKSFFFDNVLKSLSDKEKRLLPKNKSRCALQERSLVSKFLYHSLAMAIPTSQTAETTDDCRQRRMDTPTAIPLDGPRLPEPRAEEQEPDTSSRRFSRDVVWQFEELRMLIGSDLPIFGGTTRPCVSLRLRDVRRPINVLTGLDYWLDNLMCNVPELVMCYHLDGFVQKYELIKTEDLPQLEGSKFSPKVIRDVAQNILSFLKANAAKAGHTYWLFKGKGDDAVKLYDLSSLGTPDGSEDKGQNPFTVPVAMLLYRVARNMRRAGRPGTLRLLLQNCTSLLAPDRCPQIAASAHFMLADLSVPTDSDPAAPPTSRRSPRKQGETSQGKESNRERKDAKVGKRDEAADTMNLNIGKKRSKTSQLAQDPDNKSSRQQGEQKHNRECANSNDAAVTQNLNLDKKGSKTSQLLHGKQGDPSRHEEHNRDCNDASVGNPDEISDLLTLNLSKQKVKISQSVQVCPGNQEAGYVSTTWRGQKDPDKKDPEFPNSDQLTETITLELDKNKVLSFHGDTKTKIDPKEEEAQHPTVKENKLFRPEPKDKKSRPNGGITSPNELRGTSQKSNGPGHGGKKNKGVLHDEAQVSRDGTARITVTALSRAAEPNRPRERAPAPNWTPAQRCQAALEHVALGLRCLQFCADKPMAEPTQEDMADEDGKEENPSFARPFQAIPMPYSSLNEDAASPNKRSNKGAATSPKAALAGGKAHAPAGWQAHLRVLLLEKAALVYATLSEQAAAADQFATATRSLAALLRCHRAARALAGAPPDNALLGYFLGRAGDCCIMAIQNWTSQETSPPSSQDLAIAQEAAHDSADVADTLSDALRALDFALDSLRSALAAGVASYAAALAHEPNAGQRGALRRRLGNAHNELAALVMRGDEETSRKHLAAAATLFRAAGDTANLALVLCNEGRLERQQPGPGRLRAALLCYRTAHVALGSRSVTPPIWDTVAWETSTTLYLLATGEQDAAGNMPSSVQARQVRELLHAALASCTESALDNARRPVYEFRGAALHHRLAALHAAAPDKRLARLARKHWALAAAAFAHLERPPEFLRAQLEHLALLEAQAHETPSLSGKMKLFESALALVVECRPILRLLVQGLANGAGAADDDPAERAEECQLVMMLKQKMQFVLLKLTQLSAKGVQGNASDADVARAGYKTLYGASIAAATPADAPQLAAILLQVLAPVRSPAFDGNGQSLDELSANAFS